LQAGGAIQQHEQQTGEGTGTPVPGVVRLMTEEPLELASPSPLAGVRERAAEAFNRRPWVLPACLLGAGGIYLMLRRRR